MSVTIMARVTPDLRLPSVGAVMSRHGHGDWQLDAAGIGGGWTGHRVTDHQCFFQRYGQGEIPPKF